MKTYEKPSIAIVSITANSSFCSCGKKWGDLGGEFSENAFEVGGCSEEWEFEGYCKFTGANLLLYS